MGIQTSTEYCYYCYYFHYFYYSIPLFSETGTFVTFALSQSWNAIGPVLWRSSFQWQKIALATKPAKTSGQYVYTATHTAATESAAILSVGTNCLALCSVAHLHLVWNQCNAAQHITLAMRRCHNSRDTTTLYPTNYIAINHSTVCKCSTPMILTYVLKSRPLEHILQSKNKHMHIWMDRCLRSPLLAHVKCWMYCMSVPSILFNSSLTSFGRSLFHTVDSGFLG